MISDPELAAVNVDGHEVELHIVESLNGKLVEEGVAEVYVELAASAIQKVMEEDPMAFQTYLRRDAP